MKLRLLNRFIRRNDGVAAVETALLFPLLIILFVGGIETMNYLEAKRAVTNASFSLAHSAGAADIIDKKSRRKFKTGHQIIFQNASLTGIRAELTGVVKTSLGAVEQDWTWNVTKRTPKLRFDQFKSNVQSNIVNGEGVVVAVVEANYKPLLSGFIPQLSFSAFHAKVPIKRTVALYQ